MKPFKPTPAFRAHMARKVDDGCAKLVVGIRNELATVPPTGSIDASKINAIGNAMFTLDAAGRPLDESKLTATEAAALARVRSAALALRGEPAL